MTDQPKSKTAIRQLIEFGEKLEKRPGYDNDFYYAIGLLIEEAKSLESVNEQQIIDAYEEGVDLKSLKGIGQQYFNDKFEKP